MGFYRSVTDGQPSACRALERHRLAGGALPDGDISILSAVSGASLGDMWAVEAGNTFILHGRSWTQAPSPIPSSNVNLLGGVAAVSATDAWAVGQFFAGTGDSTLVLHWNGQKWTQTAAPAPGSQSELAAVAATSW